MNWKKMMAVGLAAVSMMAFVTGCGGDTKKVQAVAFTSTWLKKQLNVPAGM